MADYAAENIHPIIQAMLANAEFKQKERSQEETKRRNKAEESNASEQRKQEADRLKEEQRQHDLQHEYNKGLLDIHTKTLANELEKDALNRRINLGKGVQEGTLKPQAVPGVIGAQSIPGVEGIFPQGSFQSPEEHLKQMGQQAGEIAGGQAQALEPFKAADDARARQQATDVANINHQNDLLKAQMNEASQLRVAQVNNAARLQNTALAGRYRLEAAKNGVATDEDTLNNYYNDLYVTGTRKSSTIPAKLKPFVEKMAGGAAPLGDNPKDSAVIDSIPKIQEILGIADKLSEYSYRGDKKIDTLLGGLGLDSERLKLENQLKGLAGNISETFGKEVGRKTEQDIKRATELLHSAMLSPDKNKENVKEAGKIFDSVLRPIISKYDKNGQLDKILAGRNIDPESVKGARGSSAPKKKMAIQLDNGDKIPDTPENRKLHGIPLEAQ